MSSHVRKLLIYIHNYTQHANRRVLLRHELYIYVHTHSYVIIDVKKVLVSGGAHYKPGGGGLGPDHNFRSKN